MIANWFKRKRKIEDEFSLDVEADSGISKKVNNQQTSFDIAIPEELEFKRFQESLTDILRDTGVVEEAMLFKKSVQGTNEFSLALGLKFNRQHLDADSLKDSMNKISLGIKSVLKEDEIVDMLILNDSSFYEVLKLYQEVIIYRND